MGSALSVLASVAILRSTVKNIVPEEVRIYLWGFARRFFTEITISIQESCEGSNNRLFYAAATYLDAHTHRALALALSNSALPQRLTVSKSENSRNLMFGPERNSEIVDTFEGVPIKWKYNTDFNSAQQVETRWYELKFHKKHAQMVKNNYLPHLLEMAKAFKDQNRIVRFHTVRHEWWSSSRVNNLAHPMTFDTLFMDGDLKETVLKDLNSFSKGKEYYKRIGKVWKRGYLLYGPPGTGKSSLIAAMANYLNYDIYNLNLSSVHSDSGLENLLLHLPSRSILVVEDIDCCINLQNRESKDKPKGAKLGSEVTLAGLLNAIDGLLSCCGDEKITVFTTNYRDRIDPALLRPGRMDMHISLSYCTFSTFKQLAAAYLDIFNDDMFSHIEKLIDKVKVSPAEVAGELMKAKSSKTSLHDFIKFLESKESEEQSPVAPPITSNVDGNTPKAENNNDSKPTQKDGSKGQLANTMTTKLANDQDSSNHINIEAKYPAPMMVGEYAIKAELHPILEAVFSKHGDIAANTTLHSMRCRSSLLEIACGIVQKLQTTKLENLTQLQLKSMFSAVEDLETVKLDVGWLRKRLVEIDEAIRLNELKAIISNKFSDTIFSNQQVKFTSNCDYKSLAEGLL